MKSSTLIASYLWRDTWSRWLEQPSNLIARLFIGGLLVMVATLILAAFALMERSVQSRLERFGLNTLVVRELVHGADPEFSLASARADRLEPLGKAGLKLQFRQMLVRAQTDWQKDLLAMTYSPEMFPALLPWLSDDSPLVCLSDSLPENFRIQIALEHQSGVAVVRRMPDSFRPLGQEDILLVPQGWAPAAERLGYMETTLFERKKTAAPLDRYVDSIRLMYALDRRPAPQIQSSIPLLRELDELKARQAQWRILLAAILGLSVALVYGAISVLEFRQNLFVSALLRSLGTPSRLLYLRHWGENALLANVAAIVSIAVVAWFHHSIFGKFGFTGKVLDLSEINPYWSSEVLLVLACVNAGAFFSSIPVAFGLRRPVGAVLN
jgi:hypothetical protein